MTEAERLQKIVTTQEAEVRRLRKLLSIARVALVEYEVIDGKLNVICTCIGVDEYHFLEKAIPELTKIAEALTGQLAKMDAGDIKDLATGEPMEGGVSPTT